MKQTTAVFPKLLLIITLPLILGSALLAFALAHAPQDHVGPIPPIADGYGSWGSHAVITETFALMSHDQSNSVTIYYPADQTAPAPTLFFAVGWDVPCVAYDEFLHFFASKGYTAVCDEYETTISIIGSQLSNVFTRTAVLYPTRIDTDKFGLAGHSSGGGLLSSVSYTLIRDEGWGGTDGQNAFLFFSAPWIDFDITDGILADYPAGVKAIMQTYEDDVDPDGTDLRTYIDQFESLTAIPDSEKEYITLRTSSISGYTYTTDHRVLATGGNGYGVFDGMDDYGVFRLIDALADYTFNGSPDGKLVALGDGVEQQIEMGALRDLVSTDDPRPIPGVTYDFPCDIAGNPRQSHCADYDDELPAPVLLTPTKHLALAQASPLFVWEPITTAVSYDLQLRPLLPNGDPDSGVTYGVDGITAVTANCQNAAQNCTFTLSTSLPMGNYVWWIRAESDTIPGVWSRRGYFTEAVFVYLPIVTSQ